MFVLVAFVGWCPAQTITGQISGTVADPSGGIVAGAKVTLHYNLTGQDRGFTADSSGVFTFPDLVPGDYTLTITAPGFETYTQKDIVVGASEKVAMHEIRLSVGTVATEVTVEANQAHVETDSSDHTQLLTDTQYDNVPDRGRNYLDYLQLLPGVTRPPNFFGAGGQTDAPGWGSGAVSFNGGAQGEVVMQLDGVTSMDTGQTSATGYISPSVDAIKEVDVQVGNMNAEYGSRGGGTVNIIIKNGTKQFHGSLYEYNRNDDYNANSYFNKLTTPAIPRPPYKYNNWGGTIGGPIIIPGTNFNKNRDKLFFFFSADYIHRTEVTIGSATQPSAMTVPTPAERNGIFYDLTAKLTGQAVNVETPCTSYSSGNLWACQVPSSASNFAGTKFLDLLPAPTCLRKGIDDASAGLPAFVTTANSSIAKLPICTGSNATTANYDNSTATPHPWNNEILRTDYNLAKNELMYVRLIKNFEQDNFGFLGGPGSWPQLINLYTIHSSGAVANLVSTVRPNLVNELVIGTNRALQVIDVSSSVLAKNQLGPNGFTAANLPELFPNSTANTHDIIPDVNFGGGIGPDSQNSPVFQIDASNRFPFFGTDTSYNITDNVSWIKENHNFKFGIYFEKTSRNTQRASIFQGSINFAVTSTLPSGKYVNPFDTGSSFANAYLGVMQSYQQADSHPVGHGRYHQIEWFGQDTWKATRRITLDYGVRFQYIVPDTLGGQTVAEFVPEGQTPRPGGVGSAYNPNSQPAIIKPCTDSSGNPAGCDPNSSQTFAASAVGLFVPGSGTPYQGMVEYRDRVKDNPPLGVGPRFGFSWDIFGDGKMALRGGFGMFYDRPGPSDPEIFQFLETPPLIHTSTVFNTTIGNFLASPPQGLQGPASVNGTVPNFTLPQSYQYSLGVQRDLGHGVLLDVSYVGNQGRHGMEQRDLNTEPYGTHFLPTSSIGGNLLPDVFLVPSEGYNTINYTYYDQNSNYNSLQTTVNKRFGQRLTIFGSWTYAKVLQYSGLPNESLGIPDRAFYGPGGQDIRHNLVINWTYNLPDAPFQNAIAKEALNGWSISGIVSMQTGLAGSIFYSPFFDATGSNDAPSRPNLIGNPYLRTAADPKTQTPPGFLNPKAFQAADNSRCTGAKPSPAACGFGNAGPTQYYGPGLDDWSFSLAKGFPLGKNEDRKLGFQFQAFNAFNHTEFNGINTFFGAPIPGSTFNVNSSFGQFNNTQPARILVLSLRLQF